MKKLNIGCGSSIIQGYDNIDLYCTIDGVIHGDIENLESMYPMGTVDEIIASDIIEHISHTKVDNVLASWCRLLKPEGTIWIKTPDSKKQAEMFLSGLWSLEVYRYMLMGGQEHDGNYHYTVFTSEYLVQQLQKNDIIDIKVEFIHECLNNDIRTSSNANMIINGKKRYV